MSKIGTSSILIMIGVRFSPPLMEGVILRVLSVSMAVIMTECVTSLQAI
jgi:hypothetical protein